MFPGLKPTRKKVTGSTRNKVTIPGSRQEHLFAEDTRIGKENRNFEDIASEKKNKTKKIYQWLTSSQSEARYRKIQCPITVHNMANRPAAGLYLHNQEPYTQNKAGIIFSITQQTIVSMSLRKDIIFPPNDWTSM